MKARAAMDKPSARATSRKAKALVNEPEAPASILFASALGDVQRDPGATVNSATTRRIGSPERIQQQFRAMAPQFGLLGKALSWFRTRATASQHLRLAETVSLGEKRFVAIIHVEGRKFLIGGGTAGVSLLTQLDETA
jgi:hypothetical protein